MVNQSKNNLYNKCVYTIWNVLAVISGIAAVITAKIFFLLNKFSIKEKNYKSKHGLVHVYATIIVGNNVTKVK